MANESQGLLAGLDVARLRARLSAAPYRPYWDGLTRRWREIAAFEAETGRTINIGSCAGAQITWQVREAALEYHLTGNVDALAYVHRQIDKLADALLHRPEAWRAQYGRILPYWSELHVCLAADLCRAGLDERRRADLLRLVREHCVTAPYIGWDSATRYLAGHNMAATEQPCAGICALVWGADAGVPDWEGIVARAINSCRLYCRYGLDRAAFGFEGTMYAALPLDTIYLFAELLCQRGREDLFATIPELRAYPAAVRALLFPDRIGLNPLGDGGVVNPKPYAWLLLTARHYGQPEDHGLWYEYRGPGRAAEPCPNNNPHPWWPHRDPRGPVRRDGWGHDLLPFLWWDAAAPRPPVVESTQPTATYSPGTELAFCRTSWGKDAVYASFSGGGRGHCALDHAHADGGHFTLFAHGEYLAMDTGYWNVYENQHSVVLIDGAGQFNRSGDERYRKHYAGRLAGWQRHALLDYAMADLAHPRNCVWADRHFLFVRCGGDDAYLVLLDSISPDHRVHRYDWQLQAHPASTVTITGPTTATVARHLARLDLTFVAPPASDFARSPHTLALRTDHVYGAYVQGHTGALAGAAGVSKDYLYTEEEARREAGDLSFSSFYRPRLVAEQTGPNCLLLAVISPRRATEAPRPVRVVPAPRVFCVAVDCGTHVDTIIAALDHGQIALPGVCGATELALVRRAPTGHLLGYWTVDGQPLNVD